MLRLALDEHLPPALVDAVARQGTGLELISLRDLEHGAFLGLRDEPLLAALATRHLTLLTYDQSTIPAVLKTWGEQGRPHGGLIFIDRKTLDSADIGGLLRAVLRLWHSLGQLDWTDRVVHLYR